MINFKRFGIRKISKNKLVFGKFKVAHDWELPIAVMQGEPGQTCFVLGGLHGDEINGPRLVQKVMHDIEKRKVRGTIIFLPLVNVSGFEHKQRRVKEDNVNLNRAFKKGNTTAYRVAKHVFEGIVKHCNFGIDCHDGGTNALLPHSRVHVGKDGKCGKGCTLSMGKLLATKFVLQREGKIGMLAMAAYRKLKIPVLTVEVGGGMVLWEELLDEAVVGIKNILGYYGMIDWKLKKRKDQFMLKNIDRLSYKAKISGLVKKRVKLGDDVHENDLLAVVHSPLNEKTQEIRSKHCGVVFSIRMHDIVNEGENVLSVLQTKVCTIHKTKENLKKLKGNDEVVED